MLSTRVTRRDFLQSASLLAAATVTGRSVALIEPSTSDGETVTSKVESILQLRLQTEEVVDYQVQEYLMKRVLPLPHPKTADQWTAQEKRLRRQLLEKVIFHGWPKEWVDAPTKFEDLGLIPSGKGYRTRKLRYQIVPGFFTTALLREPENPSGKCPATLNLNGHDSHGKSTEYEQKRCINNALQGMYALSLEWFGMGEMTRPEDDRTSVASSSRSNFRTHWNGAHLNLVGASATGLFYLAIRRGLDYLCQHPNVDSRRIGATGLSGGAWQTIMIGSLDERIAAVVPAMGYFSFTSAIERNSDVGDMEYHPCDLFSEGGDYSTLTAMMAPRPTMLIYGATDQYGLRAPLQKPHLYDEIKPFFRLYGKEDDLVFYENIDPGTHNYQLDNRQQSYAFFTKHFNMPHVVEREVNVDSELKSSEELVVGTPKDNLTLTSLAKKMALAIQRTPIPEATSARAKWAIQSRAKLKDVVRYTPVSVKHAWPLFSDRTKELKILGYRLEFNNGLSATAVCLESIRAADNAPIAILLDDSGMRWAGTNTVFERLSRGEQVLAVNLLFTGDASPDYPKNEPVHVPEIFSKVFSTPAQIPEVKLFLPTRPPSALYGLLLSAAGDRSLGMQAAQLVGIANWLRQENDSRAISVETRGIRNQVTALVAAGLEPTRFSELIVSEGMKSFGYLLDNAVRYQDAPDLFCLDLYKYFDIDSLATLPEPTKVTQRFVDSRLA
jgi:dienelactone hydrolase